MLVLFPEDLLLLNRDHLLRTHPLDAHFFGDDGLPGGRLRERPRLFGTRFLCFDLRLILRLPNHEIARGLGDLGVGLKLRPLSLLQRL